MAKERLTAKELLDARAALRQIGEPVDERSYRLADNLRCAASAINEMLGALLRDDGTFKLEEK